MTTETIDTQNAVETGGEPARRTTRRRRTADTGQAARTRSRATRPGGEDLVASLTEMVDRLIEENRELKRALARAERASEGPGLGQVARTLSGLQRRVSRALESTPSRGRAAAAPAAAPRPRRKVTDPEVLERRRQALVKARAARLAKRQAQAAG